MSSPEETNTGPVIRDLRRIDPVTGRVRGPGQPGAAPAGAGATGPAEPQGAGKPRPGRHAVSRPGGQPGTGTAAPGEPGEPGGAAAATGPAGQQAGVTGRDSSAGPAGAGRVADELAE